MNWEQLDLLCANLAKLKERTGVAQFTVYLTDKQWQELRGTLHIGFPEAENTQARVQLQDAMTRGSFTFYKIDVRLR